MSYSRRQLYAMGETFGDSATRMEAGGRIVYGGGGGGDAPKTVEPTTRVTEYGPDVTSFNRSSTNEIPRYLTDASQDLVARGQALSSRPYEAYTGNRVAEFSPDMQTAFGRMRNQQVAGQIGQATGLAGLAGERAMQVGSSLGAYNPYEMGGFTAEKAQQYMNPYMQSVVDIERRKAQEAADQQSAMLSGQAAKMGAFGGSGAALQQRALRRDTAQQLADLQTQGMGRAFEQGLSRFGAEEAMREQSRQFGADYGLKGEQLGLEGLRTGLAASSQLGQLGQTQFGQEMDITKGLGMAGDVQRQREQALLDVGYGDYLTEQRYPYEQLAFQQSLVSGVPYSTTQRSAGQDITQRGKTVEQTMKTTEQAPGAAAGGEIRSYADGGITSLLSDQQIAQRQQMPNISDLARMSMQAEEMERARMRAAQQAMMAQVPQDETVATKEMNRIAAIEQGIGGLEMRGDLVGDASMAGGGIIAFANEGAVPAPSSYRNLSFEDLKPYREGAYLRSRSTRIDPITNQPIEFGDFLRLQQAEVAQAARPAAQSIIQAAPSFIPTDASDNRFARKPAPDMSGTRGPQGIAQLVPKDERKNLGAADTGTDTGGGKAAPSASKRSSMVDDIYGPIETEMKSIGEAERKALEDVEKDIKDEAKEGNSFADKARERINARLKGLEGEDKAAAENSILQFGLGLLAVKGEKNKAKALSELGLNTLKGHGEAVKALQAKQERYEDAVLEIEKIEMGDRRATRKDLRELQLKKAQAEIGVRKSMVNILGERGKTIFDMYKLDETNRNALRVANARGAGGAKGELTQAQRGALMNNAVRLADAEIDKDFRLKYSITPAERQAKRNAVYQQLLDAALGQDTMTQGTSSASAQDPLGLR